MGKDDAGDREEQLERLFRLVRGMRVLQKKTVFAPNDYSRLDEAERRVDAVLFENKRLEFDLSIEPEIIQANIFGPNGEF